MTKRSWLTAVALFSVIVIGGGGVSAAATAHQPPATALYSFDCNSGAGRLVGLQNRRTRLDEQIAGDDSRVAALLAHPKKGTSKKANRITRQIESISVRVELVQARIDQLEANIQSRCEVTTPS